MNETRVIERLNQKHSSGRKRVVLCGQREIEGERGREGMERECVCVLVCACVSVNCVVCIDAPLYFPLSVGVN